MVNMITANAIVMRTKTLTTSYTALGSHPNDVTVDVTCPSTNSGVVYFEGDDASDVPWQPGETHNLSGVDLSAINVKGTAGDKVTVIGGEW